MLPFRGSDEKPAVLRSILNFSNFSSSDEEETAVLRSCAGGGTLGFVPIDSDGHIHSDDSMPGNWAIGHGRGRARAAPLSSAPSFAWNLPGPGRGQRTAGSSQHDVEPSAYRTKSSNYITKIFMTSLLKKLFLSASSVSIQQFHSTFIVNCVFHCRFLVERVLKVQNLKSEILFLKHFITSLLETVFWCKCCQLALPL